MEEGFFPVVSAVERVLFTVHFLVRQRTIDFRGKLCFLNFLERRGGGGGVTAESSQVSDMFPKGSQYHLTFIPYALANAVLLSPIYVGQTEETLCMKIGPSLTLSLHSFIQIG